MSYYNWYVQQYADDTEARMLELKQRFQQEVAVTVEKAIRNERARNVYSERSSTLKKSLFLLILTLFFIAGCSNNVNYSVKYLDVTSADDSVKKWIENSQNASGIYLGKANETGEIHTYYLYVKFTNPIDSISINSNDKESISINTIPKMPDQVKDEKLFYITIKEESLEKIILNDEDILISSIPVIE